MYLIEIPHQTTTGTKVVTRPLGCILSKFHIKPQLIFFFYICVISCILSKFHIKPQLWPYFRWSWSGCILSKFHIKPQLCVERFALNSCCILSKFHIKPQPLSLFSWCLPVVSYRNSTSNHNLRKVRRLFASLYLIEIPHQTTTPPLVLALSICCILSKFHIKPQL